MFKICSVVLLPTNEKAKFNDLVIHPVDGLLMQFKHQNCTEVAYHLYILSVEEIKEGDWYCSPNGIISKMYEDEKLPNDWKKIIATTNKDLTINSIYGIDSFDTVMFGGKSEIVKLPQIFNLPQPSQEFIESYIKAYNDRKPITEILVEYDYCTFSKAVDNKDSIGCSKCNNNHNCSKQFLKISENNTINIKLVKDSFSRKEVDNLLLKALTTDGKGAFNMSWETEDAIEYIKNNLK